MKETRPLHEILDEIQSTILDHAKLPLYQHWLYTGLIMPRAKDLPAGAISEFRMDFTLDAIVERKRDAFNQAVEENNPYAAIMILTERPFRLLKFLEWEKYIEWESPDTRLTMIRDLWVDSEHPSVNQDTWRSLWLNVINHPHHESIYTIEELDEREQLDGVIKLYRGVTNQAHRAGLAWTANEEKAEWFAKRWVGYTPGKPAVQSIMIAPESTIGPFNQRGEAEFITPFVINNHSWRLLK